MPITGHRNSYSVIKGQIPNWESVALVSRNDSIIPYPRSQRKGDFGIFIGGSGGARSRGPRITLPHCFRIVVWTML